MTGQIMLQNNKGFSWHTDAGVSVKGFVHDSAGGYRSDLELCRYFAQAEDYAQFRHLLQSSNGSFAVVIERPDAIWAATDQIRSFPLFYTTDTAEGVCVADLAPIIKAQLGDVIPEQKAIDEYLMTAYVTGRDTLYQQIRQLSAGQCLCFVKKEQTLQIDLYYQYVHQEPNCAAEAELIAKLDAVHQRVFERLIQSLNGRTAVLPLSGGLDSRLVAVMLKRLNYPRVICFSYGPRGNSDATVSEAVAKFLDYPWLFVEHTRQTWHAAYQSEERREFYPYAANLCSMPHIQDWEAVRELRSRGLIPLDAVFIPGHSGDFLEGSHLPPQWQARERISGKQLYSAILHKHYRNWPWQRTAPQYAAQFRQSIGHTVTIPSEMTLLEAVSKFEQWDWQERQAKFIVNSVRVYEYFGYEWRLPLWDAELMDYWAAVPTEQRFGRRLYLNYMKAKQDMGIDAAKHLPALHIRALHKAVRIVFGNILDNRFGRFGDSKVAAKYLTQTIAQCSLANLSYPSFVGSGQRVLKTDLIAIQSLISLQEIL